MKLKLVKREEYVLDFQEFEHERLRAVENSDNGFCFLRDLKRGVLDRYKGTFVAYKQGVLCGQSKDEEILRENVYINLCTPNVNLYKVEINNK